MKNKILILTAVLMYSSAGLSSVVGSPFFQLSNTNSPKKVLNIQKPNTIEIDGRKYTLPDSLKVIKAPNGKFKIDQADRLGHKVGNGGDYIRSTFIQLGQKVLHYLTATEVGIQIVKGHSLNVDDLKQSLDINSIALTNDTLFDNTGSVVDAIGVPGLIILNSQVWLDHFENDRNVYYLIFHEMLRSSAVNDDNYLISNIAISFPANLRVVTRLLPLIPMIEDDSIATFISLSNITAGGNGCSDKRNYFTELDLTKNSIEISLNNYAAQNQSNRLIDRKSCNLAIPIKLPTGKRLVISLVDLQGVVALRTNEIKSAATINFEAFLGGKVNPINTKTIPVVHDERSFLFRRTDLLTSGCGTQEVLRLNTSARLVSKLASGVNEAPTSNTVQVKKISVLTNVESCN